MSRRGIWRNNAWPAEGSPPVLAVLDLGSNNCRLLIAQACGPGEFRVIGSFSRIVRLGEGVARTGRLSDPAIARTLDALSVCGERIHAAGATHLRAIATAACRGADNAQDLVAGVLARTGITLEIVSSEEEARLAAVGCAPLISPSCEGALVFDIGGGSTEVIWMEHEGGVPRIVRSQSVSVGVVSLAEEVEFARMDNLCFDAMRERMTARFAAVRAEMDRVGTFDPATHHLLGTSGTVTTLAAVALGLDHYVRARVDGSWHDCADILAVIDRLASLDHAGRAAVGSIGADRADLVLPGCAIFAAIHALWPCLRLRVADRGLREGMLRELLLQAQG